jgi:hypothetical protein
MATKNMEQSNNQTIYLIFKEIFYILSGALAVFIILELAWPGVVLAYININWVLIFWLLVGIVILSSRKI